MPKKKENLDKLFKVFMLQKAVLRIQHVVKIFIQMKKRKLHAQGKTTINLQSPELVYSKGIYICSRYQMLLLFYFKNASRLKLKIHDVKSCASQDFIFENVRFEYEIDQEFEEYLGKIFKTIRYSASDGKFFLLNENSVKEKEIQEKNPTYSLIIKNPGNGNDINEKLIKRSIYLATKIIDRIAYQINIRLVSEKYAEVFAVKKIEETTKFELKINYDFNIILNEMHEENKEAILGKLIIESLTTNCQGELCVNVVEMKKKIAILTGKETIKSLAKIQLKHRTKLALCIFKEKFNKKEKKKILLTQFALRIGPNVHLIKILSDKNKNGVIYVSSNRAQNSVEIALSQILQPNLLTENIESFLILNHLRNSIPKTVAFNPTKRTLCVYKKRNKSNTSSINDPSFLKKL